MERQRYRRSLLARTCGNTFRLKMVAGSNHFGRMTKNYEDSAIKRSAVRATHVPPGLVSARLNPCCYGIDC
jgi:hypothetical protein